ncbi:Metallo-hydrolase/oxidoreductase [Fistulina hepatica ATCC 64428]|uniref:Metallo-hydrolase/oxidoreductase n=1 Tax=Fistulina hepatica ATCC 64428 TaxID=1128425 RepID=A0A0D7A632_9AGAR|nr:Metallo-hydrolase/oxidoreductase [Fistulina hepatica ATCC 64428]
MFGLLNSIAATKPSSVHGDGTPGTPLIHSFWEPDTSTWQYLVVDPSTKQAVLIDPVLDFDPPSGTLSTRTADGILSFIENNTVNVTRILETHAHADHLTASQYFKSKLPGNVPVCIGKRIKDVQATFAPVYGFGPEAFEDTFDIYLQDDEVFNVGDLTVRVLHLPGHTPDHLGYVIDKAVFTGDSIFLPDVGSARADFPGGNAVTLFSSISKLMALPEDYKTFVGHDYAPGTRVEECVCTVAEQRRSNKHSKVGTSEESFVEFRTGRDNVLKVPRLLHPSLQVNIRAGKLPEPDSHTGRIHLKIPLRGAVEST